jgi:hypothetical protein
MRIELDVRTTDGIAELSEGIGAISSVADALDLLAEVFGLGTSCLILHAEQLAPAFFDLRTGLAGEILQKCANYQIRVALVGDFSGYTSKSLHAFIVECNRGRHIFFCASRDEAIRKLSAD